MNIDEMINQEPPKGLSWKAIVWIVVGFLVACLAFQLFFREATKEATVLAKQTEVARDTGLILSNSIQLFHLHNAAWPVGGTAADWEGTSDDADLMAELLLSPSAKRGKLGPGMTMGVRTAKLNEHGIPVGGLSVPPPPGKTQVVDAWGNVYKIRIDSNNDGNLADPETAGATVRSPQKNLVWSAGPDGDFTTWHDNVKNW